MIEINKTLDVWNDELELSLTASYHEDGDTYYSITTTDGDILHVGVYKKGELHGPLSSTDLMKMLNRFINEYYNAD